MQGQNDNTWATETFRILGDVDAPGFAGWIARHAQRLGLQDLRLEASEHRLDVTVTGPAALLDAMALGCSLGPQEVLVDEVQRGSNRLR